MVSYLNKPRSLKQRSLGWGWSGFSSQAAGNVFIERDIFEVDTSGTRAGVKHWHYKKRKTARANTTVIVESRLLWFFKKCWKIMHLSGKWPSMHPHWSGWELADIVLDNHGIFQQFLVDLDTLHSTHVGQEWANRIKKQLFVMKEGHYAGSWYGCFQRVRPSSGKRFLLLR